jgi:hypothetical protein
MPAFGGCQYCKPVIIDDRAKVRSLRDRFGGGIHLEET